MSSPSEKKKVWSCKIGDVDASKLPLGADQPMRQAIKRAFKELTGEDAEFCFSGWGATLDQYEQAVVDEGRKGKPQ